jgi:hypothetical protein
MVVNRRKISLTTYAGGGGQRPHIAATLEVDIRIDAAIERNPGSSRRQRDDDWIV